MDMHSRSGGLGHPTQQPGPKSNLENLVAKADDNHQQKRDDERLSRVPTGSSTFTCTRSLWLRDVITWRGRLRLFYRQQRLFVHVVLVGVSSAHISWPV
jgi:hypothetical protein